MPRFDLDFIRVAFYLMCFFYFLPSEDARNFMQLGPEYWSATGLFATLSFLAPPLSPVPLFELLWKASFLFCSVGLGTRYFKWICALSSCFYLGYSGQFVLYPVENMVITHILILFAFSDIGKSLSLDSILTDHKPSLQVEAWPIRFIQIALVLFWFGAGLQKIRLSNVDWFLVNHVKLFVNQNEFVFASNQLVQFGLFLSLCAELLSPLVFVKKLKWPLLGLLFLFHGFTILSMSLTILTWLFSFIFWIEPTKVKTFSFSSKKMI